MKRFFGGRVAAAASIVHEIREQRADLFGENGMSGVEPIKAPPIRSYSLDFPDRRQDGATPEGAAKHGTPKVFVTAILALLGIVAVCSALLHLSEPAKVANLRSRLTRLDA